MAVASPTTAFDCPRCGRNLLPEAEGATSCPSCRWHGEAYLCNPVAVEIEAAKAVLPDDAACVHHPTKQAVAVCAGSGDYVCSLCAVPLDGETYSAQYLSKGGKKKAEKAFERRLARPDRELSLCLVLCLLVVFAAPICLPLAIRSLVRMIRQRRTDPVYRRIVGRGSVIVSAVITGLFCALIVLVILVFIF